jgi:predicted regulator of Ras-like GTPase activity (Roadblock/LC7/MglB family)
MAKTPADKWKDTVVKYRKQCQNILKLSNSIRYAGVINAYGRTLTGMVKPDLKPLLKSEQVKNEFFIISTLMSLRKETIGTVGTLEHVILQHQKVTIVILQKKDITFYVSINRKEKGLGQIISSIKRII